MITIQDEIPLEERLTVRLTCSVSCTPEQVAWAREQERRRWCRELHDGLGPQLASLTLKLETARNLLAQDPLADTLLAELTAHTQTAVTALRCLVYELHPPALTEWGLVGAIRQHAALYRTDSEAKTLQVEVDAPDHLPPLPARVEVAAYRIAQEALANVVQHAQAHICRVCLWVDDRLHLELTDDGVGLSEKSRVGVGLLSMHERAAELGGMCVIEPAFLGGTRVSVQLPLPVIGSRTQLA